MLTKVGLHKTDINSLLLFSHCRLGYICCFYQQEHFYYSLRNLQFVETFSKLFYATDSRFSALYLDENIKKDISSGFLAFGYPIVICSLLIVTVFFFALVPLTKSISSIYR